MEQYEVGQGMFQKKTGEVIRLDDSDESERKVLEYSAFNRIQSEATGHRFLLPAALQVAEGKHLVGYLDVHLEIKDFKDSTGISLQGIVEFDAEGIPAPADLANISQQ